MSKYPRVHEVNPALGITKKVALKLDKAFYEMEQGGLGSEVIHDPSSETWENLHQADIGRNTYSRHEGISSNEQVAFAALVEKTKNQNPDLEHSEAYDIAAERFEEKYPEDSEDKDKK